MGLSAGQAYGDAGAAAPDVAAVSQGQSTTLEEIVVTAQRREENPQSVPIAITAVTAEQLTTRQIDDVASLRDVGPNIHVAPGQGNPLTAAITIRGQVEETNVPTVDPPVGLFLDGNYIARVTGANMNLVDIERVEILRGPQGTLFGRNTIGGAINIVPNKPQKSFDGSAEILFGNYDHLRVTGVLNAPLPGGEAAFRIAAQHAEHSGFARTVVLDRDLNDDDTDFVRAQLRLSPDDRWDVNLAFDYSDTSTSNQWITLLAAMPPATLLPAASGHPDDSLENYRDPVTRRTHASHAGGFDSRTRGISATVTYPFARHTLKAIAAFRDLDSLILGTDLDGTPYDIATTLRQEQEEEQRSYELQWFGEAFDGRFEWIAGLYDFEERVSRLGRANNLVPLSTIENSNAGNVRNESRAAYVQMAANLSSTVRLQAGARLVRDRRQLTSFNSRWNQGVQICSLNPSILDSPSTCQATLPTREFDYVPFNVSVDYAPLDRLMMYAKYSRGQRAGGYNFRVTSSLTALPFDPETAVAYELGLKSDLFDRSLRLNLALFRTDYEDIQLTQVVLDESQRPAVINVNAGAARIQGGEVEVTAHLGRTVLTTALGHTDARYTRLEPGVIDVTLDSEFRNAPAWTFSAAVDVPFEFRSAAINLHADYSWRDEVFFGGDPLAREGDLGLANARFSARFANSGVELSAWCKNLADTKYIALAPATGNGYLKALPGDPRTFGVTVGYRFGANSANPLIGIGEIRE
jgi:iron complex outermembrane receptor protein